MDDDIMNKIQEVLNSEEGMKQLKDMANSLGIDLDEQVDNLSSPDGDKDGAKASKGINGAQDMNSNSLGLDAEMLIKLQKLLSSANSSDDNTRLLLALKPHFSDERKLKVDKAVKLLRLMSMLPILKESGLLGGLFTDDKQDL